jgi:hypothetical protein
MDGGSFLGQALKTVPRSNAGDRGGFLLLKLLREIRFPVLLLAMQLSARLKAELQ